MAGRHAWPVSATLGVRLAVVSEEGDVGENDTINEGSNIGERLGKLKKSESVYLHHGRRKTIVVDRILIGRAKDCQIVISDKLVSRHHALVQKIRDGYYITDLDSTNGVFVNGESIEAGTYVQLGASDVITVGRTELRLLAD